MEIKRNLPIGGNIRVIASRDGIPIKTLFETHNTVVDDGLDVVASFLNSEGTYGSGITYCAVGTIGSAVVNSQGTLFAEVARAPISYQVRAGSVVTFESFFAAASIPYVLTEVGHFMHDAGTTLNSGVLFERSTILYDNSGTAFDVTVQYDIRVGRGTV